MILQYLEIYLKLGLVFYGAICVANASSFKGASAFEILKGFLFGVVTWPLALAWVMYKFFKD
jgi:hypothetical protein